MTSDDQMTIEMTVEQAAGLRDYIDAMWTSECEKFERGGGREAHTRIGYLLDISECCETLEEGAQPDSITGAGELLTELLRGAGDSGREDVIAGLRGECHTDGQGVVRRGKALIALAQQEGFYDGVMV